MTPLEAAALLGAPNFPDGWDFTEIHRCGELAGFICTQGAEIHCFRIDSYKGAWMPRQELERITRPILEKFGHLSTKVRTENFQGHLFVKRLGFRQIGHDETSIHYKAERLKHARL